MLITADDAIRALREVVAERGPEYVYVAPGLRDPKYDEYHNALSDDCKYVEADGTPSCAVGVVVSKLDPEAYKGLVEFEGDTPQLLVNHGAIRATSGAVRVLNVFQIEQDAGNSYGDALFGAEAAYNAL